MDEPLIDDTLRRASVICLSLAASVGLCGLLNFLLVEQAGGRPWTEAPATAPFLLALVAMLLLFVSGAARAKVLRTALEAQEGEGGRIRASPELLAAFFRATVVCFALAEGAAVLGLVSALISRSSFYSYVICAASLYVMIARWPRRTAFEAFLDSGQADER